MSERDRLSDAEQKHEAYVNWRCSVCKRACDFRDFRDDCKCWYCSHNNPTLFNRCFECREPVFVQPKTPIFALNNCRSSPAFFPSPEDLLSYLVRCHIDDLSRKLSGYRLVPAEPNKTPLSLDSYDIVSRAFYHRPTGGYSNELTPEVLASFKQLEAALSRSPSNLVPSISKRVDLVKTFPSVSWECRNE